jgi:hypothetical protein
MGDHQWMPLTKDAPPESTAHAHRALHLTLIMSAWKCEYTGAATVSGEPGLAIGSGSVASKCTAGIFETSFCGGWA